MEDRINPVLYLEMSDAEPERYHASRTPEVMALPGVTRMTLFRNLHYQRKDFEPDFVFRVQDFRTLAVFEAEKKFQAPELSEGLRGLHFLHYPRPAQGFLSEGPTQGLMLVLISAREESGAQALRDWADFVPRPPEPTSRYAWPPTATPTPRPGPWATERATSSGRTTTSCPSIRSAPSRPTPKIPP